MTLILPKTIFVASLALLLSLSVRSETSLYAVDIGFGDVLRFDPATLVQTDRVTMPLIDEDPGRPDYVGATAHPDTGLIYALVDSVDPRPILATLNPSNGLFNAIGAIGEIRIPGPGTSLAFGPAPDRTLYLVTGGASDTPGAIYIVDAATGEASATGWATAGVGAHALEFNPIDGMLYHFYNTDEGGDGSVGLEKLNPATGIATSVPLSGTLFERANAVAYLEGNFYVHDRGNSTIHPMTPAGVVGSSVAVSGDLYNLSAIGNSLFGIDTGDATLREINPATGADSASTALGPAPDYTRVIDIARDPTTGILYGYAIAPFPNSNRVNKILVEIDPLSGKTANPIAVSVPNFVSITFDGAGTLYGLTRQPGSQEEDGLPVESIATINLATGVGTPTGWVIGPSGTGFGGMAIAYNSNDGLIYYIVDNFNDVFMKTINPSNGVVASVATIDAEDFSLNSLTYDSDRDLFYLGDTAELYTVTPSGVVTFVGPIVDGGIFYRFQVLPGLMITDFSTDGSTAGTSFESVQNREYGFYSSTNLTDWSIVTGFESIDGTPPVNTETNVPLPSMTKGFFSLGPPIND